MGPTSSLQLIKNMVKIKVPRGNFLLQWNPTLYVCENENLIFRIQIGEMVKIFLIDILKSYPKPSIKSKFEKFRQTKNIEIITFIQYRANLSLWVHLIWILIPPRRDGFLNRKHAVLPETKTFYHMLYGDDNFSTEIEIVTFFMVWLKATLGFCKC